MGRKKIVDETFWTDDKVVNNFSPEDKLFFLYLMTNPHSRQLGIYAINKKYMAFEIGYSYEGVCCLIDRFSNKYDLIKYSDDTGEVAIKNYLKHSIIKGGKPVEDMLIQDIKNVKNLDLLKYVYNNIKNETELNESVKNIIVYIGNYLEEKDIITNDLFSSNNNNYHYDNDNVVSYHDSSNDTFHDSLEKSKKSTTHKFVIPGIEEVKVFFKNHNSNETEAEKFFYHYDSKNWYVGKNKMVSWHSAASGWIIRNKDNEESSPSKPKPDMSYLPEDFEGQEGVVQW